MSKSGIAIKATRNRPALRRRKYYGFPIGLVLGRVSMLIGAGIVVGLAIGTWASRFRATLLSGLDPRDPATLLASVVTLAVVSALAGWLPANRASRLDPTEVLREIQDIPNR